MQQHTEVWLKYHRLDNKLHRNHWGKGRMNSVRRAAMDVPPKKMESIGKFNKHSGKPTSPTASSLKIIFDRFERGTTE